MREKIANKHLFLLFSVLVVTDQAVKFLVRFLFRESGFYFCNENLSWGISLSNLFFWPLWIGVIALMSVFYFSERKRDVSSPGLSLAFALIYSGAFSNILDRIFLGCVADFISLGFFPAFNLADVFITFGALMMIHSFFTKKRQALLEK